MANHFNGGLMSGPSANAKFNRAEASASRIDRNLPAQARIKFQTMQEEVDAISGKRTLAFERAQDARRVADGVAAEWAAVRAHYGVRKVPKHEEQSHEDAVRQSADNSAALQARSNQIQKETDLKAAPFNRLKGWLADNHAATFTAVPMPVAKRVGKETWADGIARLRGQIADLQARLSAAENAPLPSKMAKARAALQVEELAAKGKPDVSPLFEGEPARLAGEQAWGSDHRPDPRHLLAWVAPDLMLARLVAQIDAEADDGKALTPEQKVKEVARLRDELLAVEREEEAFISAGAEEYVIVPRRPEADPRAVLSLAANVPGHSAS